MEVSFVESILCPHCLAPVAADASVCAECGAAMAARSSTKIRLQDRRWFVIAIVFGASLFLGYPILWACPSFSRRAKVVLSVLVAVETVIVFWLFYLSMRWSYFRVVDSM